MLVSKKNNIRAVLYLIPICICIMLYGCPAVVAAGWFYDQRASSAAITGNYQLVSELNAIVGESQASIGVIVKSMRHGDLLYTRNMDQALVPASTLKMYTACAALLYLGADYRFSTQLWTDSNVVKKGVLQGNLYIILSGDPTLVYDDLVELMDSLHHYHISGVAGNIYLDNSAYDKRFYGPGWNSKDKDYCYAAPISASIINHNCLPFKVMPAKAPGRIANVLTSPKFFYPQIKNTVMTRRKGAHACYLRLTSTPGHGLQIDGCMPQGRYAWGLSYVVTDMPSYNKALFNKVLSQLKIKKYGLISFKNAPPHLSLLGSHYSKPLHELINVMLKKSDNIIAGAIFKKLGQLYSHQAGSWENGKLAITQILAQHAKVNTKGLRILDGSGLSPANLSTPAQMMQVLDYAYHQTDATYPFVTSLPIAGIDGTLKHRLANIARRVRAKTGTISGVATLAGYALSADNEPLAFVIMINGNKGFGWRYKAIEDKIAIALTRYRR